MDVKRRKQEQSEATRRALLDVARELFAERGFADTATEEIVQRAGVTRGALYHHFRDKTDLFQAVFEELEEQLVEKVMAASVGPGNVVDQLRRGTQAFLDACLEPATQRVVLLEAPTILGWDTWREIDAKYGLGLIRAVLQQAVDEGALEPQPVEPLAHMLLGAMNEAALLIATAKNVKRARAEVGTSLELLIGALTRR